MKITAILLVGFCFFIASCSLINKGDDLSAGTYEGHFAWGFETNDFQPCLELGEHWGITAGDRTAVDSLLSTYRSIADKDYEKVFVRLKGDPSKKGEYGHMGTNVREFKLEEIIEIRKTEPADCN